MQSGTLAAFINPFAKQVFVNNDITLSTQQLNGVILVDTSGGPVTVTLPPAAVIRAGGYFQIFALTGATDPVTVAVQGADTYNAGETASVVLSGDGEILDIFATNTPNLWGFILPAAGGGETCCPGVVLEEIPNQNVNFGSTGNVLVDATGFDLDNMDISNFGFRVTGPISMGIDSVSLTTTPFGLQQISVDYRSIGGAPVTGQTYLIAAQPCGCITLIARITVVGE